MTCRGTALRLSPFQIVGSIGIAFIALGGVFAIVLPQLSPPVSVPLEVSWALFLVGGILFWIGMIGELVRAFARASRQRLSAYREP